MCEHFSGVRLQTNSDPHLPPADLHPCYVEALPHHYARFQFHRVPCCGGKCPGAAAHLGQRETVHSLGLKEGKTLVGKTEQCKGLPSSATRAMALSPGKFQTRCVFPSREWTWREWNYDV